MIAPSSITLCVSIMLQSAANVDDYSSYINCVPYASPTIGSVVTTRDMYNTEELINKLFMEIRP